VDVAREGPRAGTTAATLCTRPHQQPLTRPSTCPAPRQRLLFDLALAQRSLRFWHARMRAGGHGAFWLLSRGPGAFVNDALAAAGWRAAGPGASDQIERRVSGPGAGGLGGGGRRPLGGRGVLGGGPC
jgi:hypothetical protein